MSTIIDREMILDLAQGVDTQVADNAFYVLKEIFKKISEELSATNLLIKDGSVSIVKSFDFASDTATPTSNLDIFVAVKSAQIELNSIENLTGFKNALKRKILDAYERVRSKKKSVIRKRKREEKQKKKKGITETDLIESKLKPYSILSFKDDCFDKIIENVSPMTIVYNKKDRIQMLSNEELGININLYPVLLSRDQYKVWNHSKSKFETYNIKKPTSKIKEKNDDIPDDNVLKLIRIYKSLYYNIYNSDNYRFIESMVVNLPDKVFNDNDIYEIFLKSINYILNTDVSKYKSIYDDTKTIYEEDGISYFGMKQFLKEISKLI